MGVAETGWCGIVGIEIRTMTEESKIEDEVVFNHRGAVTTQKPGDYTLLVRTGEYLAVDGSYLIVALIQALFLA
jgi:hypothetical protein